ncbi:MAG: penicillin-binding protein 1C [Proteobacteria bacterium]|nr:penicillin-binding protein 1C [Pseudomonadota bacterium]
MPPSPTSPLPAVMRRWPRLRRWLKRIGGSLLLLSIVAVVLDRMYPLPLPDPRDASVLVVARDGTPLRAFPDRQGIWRYPTTPEHVSPLYLQALLTYEDRWFWRHPGVNPVALARAGWQWARYGHIVSGGSTLTMQVARIIDPSAGDDRSIGAKLRQIARALQLEAHLSKRQILIIYLDRAPFGGTIQGVQAASWAYLGKPANQLSHAEAALLAVLPQMPSRLRPDRNAQEARVARDKLLRRMAQLHVWTPAQVADARIEPVVTRRLHQPMLAALLAQRLKDTASGQGTACASGAASMPSPARAVSTASAYSGAPACTQGAGPQRIVTSIDAGLQRTLEARVTSYFANLPARTSAALLVVDNQSLEARAYIGSVAFGDVPRLGHVDMVRAWRSPGSTLKPFLYGLALDDGLIHSESLLVDAPQSFGDYRPGNFDTTFSGPVGAAEALRLSLNVPAVDLLDRVDPVRFYARLANAGVVLKMPRGAKPNLSMILGGDGVTLEDLVGAYTAFHRGGIAGRVRLTPDAPRVERRLLSPGAAWIVKTILDANPRPGTRLDTFEPGNGPRVAWKTGTSYGFRDAWAIGGTRRYTVGVWVGRPDGTPLPGQYGAITALPLFFQVIDSLPRHAGDAVATPTPSGVGSVEICWPLGTAFDPAHPQLCARKMSAWTLDGQVPPTMAERRARLWSAGLQPLRVDAQTGQRLSADCAKPHPVRDTAIARWPALASPWLSAAERAQSALPPLAADCQPDGLGGAVTMQIEGVADHASVARAPNSPHPVRLALRALGAPGTVMWLVNDRLVGQTSGRAPFVHDYPEVGPQTVTAMAETGAWTQVQFRVLR